MARFFRMVGLTLDGGFGEYCLIDARASAKLPNAMTFEQAAPLMCAGITIYKAIRRAEEFGLKPGGVSRSSSSLSAQEQRCLS
jgi:D-arabinose 1-dehydrogenase-like Zn-dependent alcohol dehydrogenase